MSKLSDKTTCKLLIAAAEKAYKTGSYDIAESLYKRVLVIISTTMGREHPSVSPYLQQLADFYRARGQYSQAERIYRRMLIVQTKAYGSCCPGVATSLQHLAEACEDQGKIEPDKEEPECPEPECRGPDGVTDYHDHTPVLPVG